MGWMSFPSRNLKPPRIITSWQLPSHTLSLSCVVFSSLPRSSDAEGCQRQCTQGLPPRGRAADQPPARAHCQVLWRLRGGRPTHNGLRVHEARGPQQIPQVRETPGARWEVGSIWAGGEDRSSQEWPRGPWTFLWNHLSWWQHQRLPQKKSPSPLHCYFPEPTNPTNVTLTIPFLPTCIYWVLHLLNGTWLVHLRWALGSVGVCLVDKGRVLFW